MRAVPVLLLAILVACSNDVTEPPSTAEHPEYATLNIRMHVIGDRALLSVGLGRYLVKVDNEQAARTFFGDSLVFLTVPGGHHTLRFLRGVPQSGLAELLLGRPLPPPWCTMIAPVVLDTSVTPGSTTEVTFAVDCPPLEGTATLHLKLLASGDHAPRSIQTYLLSQAKDRVLTSLLIEANKDTTLSIRTGIYLFGLDAPGCQLQNGPYSALTAPLFLRRDSVVNVALTLPCR